MAMTEHTISTPTGRRILVNLGRGYAMVRSSFAPDIPGSASERLQCSRAFDELHIASDGIFINPRHLWAIAIGLAKKRNGPISAGDIAAMLFYDPLRPDVHAVIVELMAAYDRADPWWKAMVTHGWYEPATATVHISSLRAG